MEGMEACRRCAPGTYMPLSEGLQCFPCPGNLITRESASESESDCICRATRVPSSAFIFATEQMRVSGLSRA